MGYKNLQSCVKDLERHGQLRRIEIEMDPHLEIAAVQRRVYACGGPALLFTRVKGCRFPMLGNLFGSLDRTRFIFRDTLPTIQHMVKAKVNPAQALRHPWKFSRTPLGALHLLPRRTKNGPALQQCCSISDLPQLVSWPDDGGPFITLPQVYSEDPAAPGLRHSNLGMYRVQLGGNDYTQDKEVGLHYQIHRGIGVHHQIAARQGKPLAVNIFVGGAPSMSIAAVMPLPEGMPELSFAGLLGGHRISMTGADTGLAFPAEADFVICGTIEPERTKPEGPFGDHLGYYSLTHEFPVMNVQRVYHRPDAIWPFTSVGRPPQEDTSFGDFIHELTGDLIPTVLPGVKAVHAVDAAGVHPLLLAIGSERYTPYQRVEQPQELLTQANAILGQGQLSLAKYLFIANEHDANLDIHDTAAFLQHCLERCDWRRDLHFQTRTTIDTLDYSGDGLNQGSKVVIAACGEKKRHLPAQCPQQLDLPAGFDQPAVAVPGILLLRAPACSHADATPMADLERFCASLAPSAPINQFPLIVLCDDSAFAASDINNFLWVTFTRSDPARDIGGIGAFMRNKHWGCDGSLVIDARRKPHHAAPLLEDPAVAAKLDKLACKGGPLYGII